MKKPGNYKCKNHACQQKIKEAMPTPEIPGLCRCWSGGGSLIPLEDSIAIKLGQDGSQVGSSCTQKDDMKVVQTAKAIVKVVNLTQEDDLAKTEAKPTVNQKGRSVLPLENANALEIVNEKEDTMQFEIRYNPKKVSVMSSLRTLNYL
eukprot:Gb_20190 [translate_table: standard]